jgi:phospholipase C
MRDATDLFIDLKSGALPAVSYVKPERRHGCHPKPRKSFYSRPSSTTSSLSPREWTETAIFVTFDEGGGCYDSGFIQPVDFSLRGLAFR